MSKRSRLVEFFENYETSFNAAMACDEDAVTSSAEAFADSFVAADPSGVRCSHNDNSFRQRLKDECRFYRQVGTRAMRLEGIDTTPIDAQHIMARVHWLGEFRRSDLTDIDIRFDVVYFIRMTGNAVQIFGYVTGDAVRALRENGLLDQVGVKA